VPAAIAALRYVRFGMRATPLTVLTPIPRWWAFWLALTWPFARRSGFIGGPLHKLSFIHFARFAIVRRPGPPALLFLTSFDGSSIQYIEAFVRVVPVRISLLYGGAKGFPGARRFGPINRYIAESSHPVDHFWMAHPEASTRMVGQALALKAAYDRFAPRLVGNFEEEWPRFLTEVQGLL
jgi:hypothetical protein